MATQTDAVHAAMKPQLDRDLHLVKETDMLCMLTAHLVQQLGLRRQIVMLSLQARV